MPADPREDAGGLFRRHPHRHVGRLCAGLPDHRLSVVAVRGAGALSVREERFPAVPCGLSRDVPDRRGLRLFHHPALRLWLLPGLSGSVCQRSGGWGGSERATGRCGLPGFDGKLSVVDHDLRHGLRPVLPASGFADPDGAGGADLVQGAEGHAEIRGGRHPCRGCRGDAARYVQPDHALRGDLPAL
ncbi:UNVERIFIED_CONTAM: hypothetical protein NCL1_02764 [Trichonephila clavipes]